MKYKTPVNKLIFCKNIKHSYIKREKAEKQNESKQNKITYKWKINREYKSEDQKSAIKKYQNTLRFSRKSYKIV